MHRALLLLSEHYSVGFGGFTTVHAFAPVTFTGRRNSSAVLRGVEPALIADWSNVIAVKRRARRESAG